MREKDVQMGTERLDKRFNDEEQPASLLVELMLMDYDELVELDYVHGRMRNLYHKEGKYFAPLNDAAIHDIRRYAADHMVHPDDRELYLRISDPETAGEMMKESGTPGVTRARSRYRLLNGDWRWVEQVGVTGVEHGAPEGVCYIFLFDIQDQVDRERQGVAAAVSSGKEAVCTVRNELTGLMIEDAFNTRARALLQERIEGWCVLSVDLEHFKLFNEWYGRKHGDLLLAQIGNRLRDEEKNTGSVACYFGQDDFALLTHFDMKAIERLYADIHELIKEYGTSVGFMPAFGICMADEDSSIEELADRAALAARYAKENYHTRIRIFKPSMYQKTERDYQLLSDFQKALKDRELFIQLQPQCQIASRKIVGAESLVRWHRADGTVISPGVFVPVLERYGFVTDLDEYVWEEVCVWQKKWIDSGHTPLPISVNVSQIDIFTIDVPAFFEKLVEKYSLPVEVIKIEITESAYVDNDSVADTVRRLREKGFLVLMDDFGSGYSSLNMLRNLSVDIIKLDAQFLRMSGDDRKGVQIMETIVNMAKTMGVPIIVEGVETKEETDFLAGLGCTYVQGYYFYRPMPVEEFERLIGDPKNIDTRGFVFKSHEQFNTRDFLDEDIFSEAMLNNILGPVAFFVWRGDDVDVVHYNRQFYRETASSMLANHLCAIQQVVVAGDVPKLYGLLEQAMKAPLDGAVGELRFRRRNGAALTLQTRFFFMETNGGERRFYGVVRNVTQLTRMAERRRTLACAAEDSVVFLIENEDGRSAQVAVHGLEPVLGQSPEKFERGLNSGEILKRISAEDMDMLRRFSSEAQKAPGTFSPVFRIGNAEVQMCLIPLRSGDGRRYVAILRRAGEDA